MTARLFDSKTRLFERTPFACSDGVFPRFHAAHRPRHFARSFFYILPIYKQHLIPLVYDKAQHDVFAGFPRSPFVVEFFLNIRFRFRRKFRMLCNKTRAADIFIVCEHLRNR
jgi:hypothetical protein